MMESAFGLPGVIGDIRTDERLENDFWWLVREGLREWNDDLSVVVEGESGGVGSAWKVGVVLTSKSNGMFS